MRVVLRVMTYNGVQHFSENKNVSQKSLWIFRESAEMPPTCFKKKKILSFKNIIPWSYRTLAHINTVSILATSRQRNQDLVTKLLKREIQVS